MAVSTMNLIYLLAVAVLAISAANYTSITDWYYAQSQRLQTLLFVLGAFILMALMMNWR